MEVSASIWDHLCFTINLNTKLLTLIRIFFRHVAGMIQQTTSTINHVLPSFRYYDKVWLIHFKMAAKTSTRLLTIVLETTWRYRRLQSLLQLIPAELSHGYWV